MAPRLAFVVVFIWGLVGSTDAVQVARDKNPQALQKKSIPVEDQNTLLDASLLSALTPFDSSKGKPGDNRQIKNLLRMASGTDRLDPDAFDALFETLRTSTKTALNTSVEGIESDYNGHVAAITACETNHGFHGAPANARRIAYDAAVQSYENATGVAEQKCSTQTSNCDDQRTKAMALHNYVQTEIVNTYGCTQTSVQCPPTVFGLTDFYLKNTDNVAAELEAKHSAWETAAGMCSAATGECDNVNEDKKEKCEDVDVVAVNGRNAYDQCYGHHHGVVSGFDVDARIANQKTVVRNLEKVLCIVKVAVDSHGDTPKRDSAITCTDLGVGLSPAGGAIEYKCVCTSPSSSPPEIYSETYVTQLTLDPVPNRDTAWDPLGCAGSVISTTGITTQQPTTSTPAGSQSSSGGTGGGGSPVAQFNVGEAAITIPAAPSGLPALEGPFDFDSATVMWKIEWKCSVTRWSKPRDGVYGYFWQFIGSHPHIYFGHNFISVAWTKATPTGKVNDYIRFYWAHTPDNNPHVYRYEWSAATGETCLSIDGLVNTDGKDRVCSTGRTLLNALDTGKPVTRLNQGKYEGENQNVQGKWYYTKVYIK